MGSYACRPDVNFQPLGCRSPVQPTAPRPQNQEGRWTLRQHLPPFLKPGLNPAHCLAWQGQPPSLSTLSRHSQRSGIQVYFLDAEAAGFADSQASAVDQFHQDPVPHSDRGLEVGSFQKPSDVLQAQRLGQGLLSS